MAEHPLVFNFSTGSQRLSSGGFKVSASRPTLKGFLLPKLIRPVSLNCLLFAIYASKPAYTDHGGIASAAIRVLDSAPACVSQTFRIHFCRAAKKKVNSGVAWNHSRRPPILQDFGLSAALKVSPLPRSPMDSLSRTARPPRHRSPSTSTRITVNNKMVKHHWRLVLIS